MYLKLASNFELVILIHSPSGTDYRCLHHIQLCFLSIKVYHFEFSYRLLLGGECLCPYLLLWRSSESLYKKE